jgi:hypothetical protein
MSNIKVAREILSAFESYVKRNDIVIPESNRTNIYVKILTYVATNNIENCYVILSSYEIPKLYIDFTILDIRYFGFKYIKLISILRAEKINNLLSNQK